MNLIKKFFTAFFLAAFILTLPNVTFAEVKEFSAEGEYRLGDRDTRETAKIAALADAKRKIIEQVGVYVQSYSEMNKFNLTQDQIKTAAEAMIKIKHEDVYFYEDGTLCKVFVVASVNIDNIPAPAPVPKTDSTSDKKLKLLGIEEFNGHYYKVFNDGMNWQDAKKTCEDMGGHLVTITSIVEQEVVQNLITANGKKFHYWIGCRRVDKNNWQWITGEKFSYSKWHNGEPNNANNNEDVVVIVKQTGGTWNDYTSKAIAVHSDGSTVSQINFCGFVCEWESYDDIKI